MEGNLVIDAETLSKLTGTPLEKVKAHLEAVKNCQMLTLIHEGSLVVLLPKMDSPAVEESNNLKRAFLQHAGKRGL